MTCTYDDPMAVYGIGTYGEGIYGYIPTPKQRTLTIPAEDRTLEIKRCDDGDE